MPDNVQDPRVSFARNLRSLMKDRGVSADALAERTEFSPARIERFLAAKSEPTARDLLRIAGALDSSIEQLLGPGDG